MKPNQLLTTVMLAVVLFAAAPVTAQVEAYRFESAKVPVGNVFHFRKSQLDGSHETQISVYVVAEDRVEALKWDQGGSEATLVQAQMDWAKFSVRHFDAWHLARNATPELRATLDVQGDQLRMSLMDQPLTLTHWPWHSYDFDFTSLNFTLPHLRKPERELVFWRTDFVYTNPPIVAELGEMRLRFEGIENHAGKATRRYSISGAGLQGASGTWWADPRTGLLVEYEIPVGDEPGYDSVRMKWLRTQRMSAELWGEFKRAAVGTR